jgi:hypothetical protein
VRAAIFNSQQCASCKNGIIHTLWIVPPYRLQQKQDCCLGAANPAVLLPFPHRLLLPPPPPPPRPPPLLTSSQDAWTQMGSSNIGDRLLEVDGAHGRGAGSVEDCP